ncbi:MAG: hypothetical protein HOV66_03685 [Streptomycetaceae bacterium]|nr:hypothetical protein [Streptomycetaceae bacterium]
MSDASESDREELARRQSELLGALVAGGPVPAGFDPARVEVQVLSLAAKRRDGVERAMPGLVAALGPERWPSEFTAWARIHPKPAEGGSRADAEAFAAYVAGIQDGGTVVPPPGRRATWRERRRARRQTGRGGWNPDAPY